MISSSFKKLSISFGLLFLVSCHSSKENSEINPSNENESEATFIQLNDTQHEINMSAHNQVFKIQGRTVLVANCAIDIKIDPKESDPRIKDPCADKPIAVIVEIENQQGDSITQLKSNHIGEFSVELTKGEYTFRTQENAFISATQKKVLIEGSKTVTIILKTKTPQVK